MKPLKYYQQTLLFLLFISLVLAAGIREIQQRMPEEPRQSRQML